MYAVHQISQPISNYIKQSNLLGIYLMGALWLVFLSEFVNFACDVMHNDDGICMIVFCFIDDYPGSEISSNIKDVLI
jgi:hypothetical protein